jgi:hypothetical protein
MPGYDHSFEPPQWWLDLLEIAIGDLQISNGRLAALASDAVGRHPAWGADRISRMRGSDDRQNATTELVAALSKVLKLPIPFVVFVSEKEALAVDRYLDDYRRKHTESNPESNPEREARRATVLQALDSTVKAKQGQIAAVGLVDEGSPRGPRTRRAPRGRS